MIHFLTEYYLWIKAFHVISILCWMSSMFYLPRLFVYHSMSPVQSGRSEQLKIMEYKLLKQIMTPSLIFSLLFGAMLLAIPGIIDWSLKWPLIKFSGVFVLFAMHGWCAKMMKLFQQDQRPYSHKTFRLANEIPVVIMMAIIIMVVVKPF